MMSDEQGYGCSWHTPVAWVGCNRWEVITSTWTEVNGYRRILFVERIDNDSTSLSCKNLSAPRTVIVIVNRTSISNPLSIQAERQLERHAQPEIGELYIV